MNTALVIPSKDQVAYVPRMMEAISNMTVKPDKIVYYFDRPGGRDRIEISKIKAKYENIGVEIDVRINNVLPSYVGHPQMNYGEDYFLTGFIRNTICTELIENGFDAIVFIDGDCIPEPDLIKSHTELLKSDTPIATVGQRKENKWMGGDQRIKSPSSIIDMFHDTPYIITNEYWFVDSGVVWTCNFGINKAGIEQIKSLNKVCYGREDVFSTEFEGSWGGEDGFIGLECYYLNIPVISLPIGDNGVHHIEHERPLSKYDHITFLDFLEARREELLFLMHLNGYNAKPFVPKMELYNRRNGL